MLTAFLETTNLSASMPVLTKFTLSVVYVKHKPPGQSITVQPLICQATVFHLTFEKNLYLASEDNTKLFNASCKTSSVCTADYVTQMQFHSKVLFEILRLRMSHLTFISLLMKHRPKMQLYY